MAEGGAEWGATGEWPAGAEEGEPQPKQEEEEEDEGSLTPSPVARETPGKGEQRGQAPSLLSPSLSSPPSSLPLSSPEASSQAVGALAPSPLPSQAAGEADVPSGLEEAEGWGGMEEEWPEEPPPATLAPPLPSALEQTECAPAAQSGRDGGSSEALHEVTPLAADGDWGEMDEWPEESPHAPKEVEQDVVLGLLDATGAVDAGTAKAGGWSQMDAWPVDTAPAAIELEPHAPLQPHAESSRTAQGGGCSELDNRLEEEPLEQVEAESPAGPQTAADDIRSADEGGADDAELQSVLLDTSGAPAASEASDSGEIHEWPKEAPSAPVESPTPLQADVGSDNPFGGEGAARALDAAATGVSGWGEADERHGKVTAAPIEPEVALQPAQSLAQEDLLGAPAAPVPAESSGWGDMDEWPDETPRAAADAPLPLEEDDLAAAMAELHVVPPTEREIETSVQAEVEQWPDGAPVAEGARTFSPLEATAVDAPTAETDGWGEIDEWPDNPSPSASAPQEDAGPPSAGHPQADRLTDGGGSWGKAAASTREDLLTMQQAEQAPPSLEQPVNLLGDAAPKDGAWGTDEWPGTHVPASEPHAVPAPAPMPVEDQTKEDPARLVGVAASCAGSWSAIDDPDDLALSMSAEERDSMPSSTSAPLMAVAVAAEHPASVLGASVADCDGSGDEGAWPDHLPPTGSAQEEELAAPEHVPPAADVQPQPVVQANSSGSDKVDEWLDDPTPVVSAKEEAPLVEPLASPLAACGSGWGQVDEMPDRALPATGTPDEEGMQLPRSGALSEVEPTPADVLPDTAEPPGESYELHVTGLGADVNPDLVVSTLRAVRGVYSCAADPTRRLASVAASSGAVTLDALIVALAVVGIEARAASLDYGSPAQDEAVSEGIFGHEGSAPPAAATSVGSDGLAGSLLAKGDAEDPVGLNDVALLHAAVSCPIGGIGDAPGLHDDAAPIVERIEESASSGDAAVLITAAASLASAAAEDSDADAFHRAELPTMTAGPLDLGMAMVVEDALHNSNGPSPQDDQPSSGDGSDLEDLSSRAGVIGLAPMVDEGDLSPRASMFDVSLEPDEPEDAAASDVPLPNFAEEAAAPIVRHPAVVAAAPSVRYTTVEQQLTSSGSSASAAMSQTVLSEPEHGAPTAIGATHAVQPDARPSGDDTEWGERVGERVADIAEDGIDKVARAVTAVLTAAGEGVDILKVGLSSAGSVAATIERTPWASLAAGVKSEAKSAVNEWMNILGWGGAPAPAAPAAAPAPQVVAEQVARNERA